MSCSILTFAVGIEQLIGPVSPLLIRGPTECSLETLGRNLEDSQAFLKSYEFGDCLSLDGLKTRTKAAGGTFQ